MKLSRWARRLLAASAFLTALPIVAFPAQARADVPSTAGTDFWVAFGPNLGGPVTLSVAGASATTGTVTFGDGTSAPLTVTPGQVSVVTVPGTAVSLGSDGTTNKGIHITAGQPVTVYGLNYAQYSSDAFVALPTAALGTRYRAVTYDQTQYGSTVRLVVVGTQAGTTVTVTPKTTVGSHAAGVPYTVALNAGQTYTTTTSTTLTGTLVESDKPVAVFSNIDCGNLPPGGGCDHMTEQMPPTTAWGTDFVAVRYAKQTGGDPVMVVADQDATAVSVNGSQVATLNAGEDYTAQLMTAGGNIGALIETSKPAVVTQFMTNNHYLYNAVDATGDPSSMIVPPYQQYLDSYTLATPGSGFGFNAINVAVPTTAIASFRLDGAAVNASQFAAIGSTGFSSAQLKVASGTHTVLADQPFGAFAYGANDYNSYAYPGGAGLSPVASVDHVSVSPATQAGTVGQPGCVTATAFDAGNQPVAGVRADLSVTGPNAGAVASATTGAQGQATLCYTAASAGADTVRATVGTVHGNAVITWSAAAVVPAPPTAPAAPTAVAGDEAVKVSWAAPVVNGSPITGYTVTATPGGRSCTTASTECVVYGLANNQSYTFAVVARSAAGDSAASPASAAATPAARPGTDLAADKPAPAPGQTVTLTAHGYQPGSTVTFVVESTPTNLGSALVGSDGVATLTATVPAGLSGRHTVFAVGTAADGTPLSKAIALNVGAGPLAVTGQPSWVRGAFWFGIAMVAAGAALLLAMRRKGWDLAALRHRLGR